MPFLDTLVVENVEAVLPVILTVCDGPLTDEQFQAFCDQYPDYQLEAPKDKPVLLYCNTGTLSAQAGFALRLAGYENVRILQGGFAEWKAKGGLDAASRATGTVKH